MVRKLNTLLLGLFLIMGSIGYSNNEVTVLNNWQRLGIKKVNYKLDRDVIQVGAEDGRFTKLKIKVTAGNLNMHRMVVHYGNGSKQEIELRHNFNKRSNSRVIDLKGNKRVIRKITFVYDTKNTSRRKAKVHVFGRK